MTGHDRVSNHTENCDILKNVIYTLRQDDWQNHMGTTQGTPKYLSEEEALMERVGGIGPDRIVLTEIFLVQYTVLNS